MCIYKNWGVNHLNCTLNLPSPLLIKIMIPAGRRKFSLFRRKAKVVMKQLLALKVYIYYLHSYLYKLILNSRWTRNTLAIKYRRTLTIWLRWIIITIPIAKIQIRLRFIYSLISLFIYYLFSTSLSSKYPIMLNYSVSERHIY